jgi:hypothetical protein
MSIIEMNTTNGIMVHIFPVQVVLNTSAVFTAMIFRPDGLHRATFVLEGIDYTNWGSDDNYIKNYICDKEIYLGRPTI